MVLQDSSTHSGPAFEKDCNILTNKRRIFNTRETTQPFTNNSSNVSNTDENFVGHVCQRTVEIRCILSQRVQSYRFIILRNDRSSSKNADTRSWKRTTQGRGTLGPGRAEWYFSKKIFRLSCRLFFVSGNTFYL